MSFRKFLLLTVLFSLFLSSRIYSYEDPVSTDTSRKRNSLEEREVEPRYWIGFAEAMSVNLLTAFFNRYIANFDFARINLNTMKENLTHKWVWDGDNFVTNQLGHPIHGSAYFNSGRINGLSYWESMGYSALGSLEWELFMENTYPSINDFITTTLSGAMLGEVFYRLFRRIYRRNTTGFESIWRNTLSFIVDPVAFINVKLWPDYTDFDRDLIDRKVLMKFTAGTRIRAVAVRKNNPNGSSYVPYPALDVWMVYGDPFEGSKPLDFFIMNIGFSFDRNVIANLSVAGQLYKHFLERKREVSTIFELVQDFDFYESPDYKVGDVVLGAGISSRYNLLQKRFLLFFKVSAGFIPLGGASTEYFVEEERDYNIGYGLGGKIKFIMVWKNHGSINSEVNRFIIRTMSGAAGTEDVTMGKVELIKLLYKRIGLAGSYLFYYRVGNYVDYPNVRLFNKELRLLLTFGFE